MTLLDARLNKSYTIKLVHKDTEGGGAISRRLLDMGFTAGTQIKIASIAPFGGTVLVNMRGGMVALRENAAALIQLEDTVSKAQEVRQCVR